MSMYFFFSSRRRHTRLTCDWSSDVCSSDLAGAHQSAQIELVEISLHERRRGEECIDDVVDGLGRRAQMLLNLVADPLQVPGKFSRLPVLHEGWRQLQQQRKPRRVQRLWKRR